MIAQLLGNSNLSDFLAGVLGVLIYSALMWSWGHFHGVWRQLSEKSRWGRFYADNPEWLAGIHCRSDCPCRDGLGVVRDQESEVDAA